MQYYQVVVGNETFKVPANSPAIASRAGRDLWRNQNNAKGPDDHFRIPEPQTVVVKLVETNIREETV